MAGVGWAIRARRVDSSPRPYPSWFSSVLRSGGIEALLALALLLLSIGEALRGSPTIATSVILCAVGAASGIAPKVTGTAMGAILTLLVFAPPSWLGIALHSCLIPLFAAGSRGYLRFQGVLTLWYLAALAFIMNARLGEWHQVPEYLAIWVVLMATAWLAGRWLLEVRRTHDVRRQMAMAEQRRGIARDLHDTVAQSLSSMVLRAEQLQRRSHLGAEDLDFFVDVGSQATRDLRSMLSLLRSEETRTDGEWATVSARTMRLPQALEQAVDSLRAKGFDVTLSVSGDLDSLPWSVSSTLAHVVREATSNIDRHGRPDLGCTILLEITPDCAEAIFLNSPTASARRRTGEHHWGLIGMRERVTAQGGMLKTSCDDDWMTRVVLPIESSTAARTGGLDD